jgi:hypothetical protein
MEFQKQPIFPAFSQMFFFLERHLFVFSPSKTNLSYRKSASAGKHRDNGSGQEKDKRNTLYNKPENR